VRLSGRLDLEATEADAPVLQAALNESRAGVIVEMEAVTFISSSGLRMLIATHQNAQAADKKLAIVRAKPLVYKIFKVAGLSDAFRFFETEAEAVEALWA
jgi:anti-sigma B factor antagonist